MGDGRFRRFWLAQSLATLATQVSLLALPLSALVVFGATPFDVGLLRAAEYAPLLLLGLPAGALVDRLPLRPILVWTSLGRAALLGTIPLLWWSGRLGLEHLLLVAVLAGALAVFFDVAYQATLPRLVSRSDLLAANGRLQASAALAFVGGPSLAGGLGEVLSPPVALGATAAAFGAAGLALARLELGTGPATAPPCARDLRAEVVGELRRVWGHPVLRAVLGSAATTFLGLNVLLTALPPHLAAVLGFGPAAIGGVFALFGVGGILGALIAARAVARVGVGRALILALLVCATGCLLAPLAGAETRATWPLVAASALLTGAGALLFEATQIGLRQALTPPERQGRMTSTMRSLILGTAPIGALVGGSVANELGTRAALIVAGLCLLAAIGWLLPGPVRSVRHPVASG